jgi:hypothetical protein
MDDMDPLKILRQLGPPSDDDTEMGRRAANAGVPIPTDEDFLSGRVAALLPFAEPARIHRYVPSHSGWESKEVSVVVAAKPFSRGAMRSSFYCVNVQHPDTVLVAKKYRKDKCRTMEQVFADAQMHHVANHWATMFNNYGPPKRVRFLPACAMELYGRTPSVWVGIEPFMRGTYRKHNNNNGFVSKSVKPPAALRAMEPLEGAPDSPRGAAGDGESKLQLEEPTAAETRCTPQAFLHFTFHFSSGNLMVCDIQGVGDVYTDPQILTPSGEGHGRGNIGQRGITKCLKTHVCNAVCRRLGLPPLKHGVSVPVRNPLPSRNGDPVEQADTTRNTGKPPPLELSSPPPRALQSDLSGSQYLLDTPAARGPELSFSAAVPAMHGSPSGTFASPRSGSFSFASPIQLLRRIFRPSSFGGQLPEGPPPGEAADNNVGIRPKSSAGR